MLFLDEPTAQALTTLNPLTYVSEGFRSGLVPSVPHMNTSVAGLVLTLAVLVFSYTGLRGFRRRVLD